MMDTGGMIVERDLMVPAHDGVVLATDVYRPDGPGPFPVLLERTPYETAGTILGAIACAPMGPEL